MSEYEFILDNMTFSFSSLTLFEQCPYAWYLKYIECRDKASNCYADFGSYCHKILEMYAKEELKKDDLLSYYAKHFNASNPLLIDNISYDKYYSAGALYFKDCSLDLKQYKVLGVEKQVRFKIGRYNFIGYIDLLLQDGELVIILDHKSSEYPYSKSGKLKKKCIDKITSYKRQLYLYAKAVYDEFGVYPDKIMWNYFKEGQFDPVKFDMQEYEEALKWAESVVDRIYQTDEFNMVEDYFYCNRLCDFRNGECNKEELSTTSHAKA